MRCRRAWILWGGLLALPVRAEDAPTPTTLRDQAEAAFAERDYPTALRLLEAAYQAGPEPGLVANQALVYEAMGDYGRAVSRFRTYLASQPPPPREKRTAAERALERLEPEVIFTTDPPGARVYLDGAEVSSGLTPLTIRLTAGQHYVVLRHLGYVDKTPVVELVPGQPRAVHEVLTPDAPLPAGDTLDATASADKGADAGDGRRTWGWVAVGVGVAAGATAGAMLGLTVSELDDRDRSKSRAEYDDHTGTAGSYNAAYIACGAVAIAAAGVGLYLLLSAEAPPSGGAAAPLGVGFAF